MSAARGVQLPVRVLLAACVLAAVGWVFRREFAFFRAPDPRVLLEIREELRVYDDLAAWPPAFGRIEPQGFVPCGDSWSAAGWCVPPGGSGSLRYTLPETPGARGLLVRLFFFRRQPGASSRLVVEREGAPEAAFTWTNPYFADARLDLSRVLSGAGGAVTLRFEGSNPTGQPDVVVQHLETRLFADPLPAPPSVARMALAFAALGLALLPLGTWRRALPLWAILTAGAALRYYALTRALYLPLDPDAVGYLTLARTMPFGPGLLSADTHAREPLFILVVKGCLALLGDRDTTIRWVSWIGSLAAIALTARLVRRWFGYGASLLAAFVMAVSLPLVRESARGLRLELELVLLLAFLIAAFHPGPRQRWRDAAAAGMLAGLLALTRATYMVTLIPLVVLAFWGRQRQHLAATGLAITLLLGLQAPYRLQLYRQYGDAFFDTAAYARWNANAEFAGRAGFPTRLEAWKHTGQGPRLTYGAYLFQLHSVKDVAIGTLRGFWKAVRHMEIFAFHRSLRRTLGVNPAAADALFQGIALLGLLAALWRPGLRWLPAAFLCLLLPISFLYDRSVLEPWRHTYQVFPLMVGGMLVALETTRRAILWRR